MHGHCFVIILQCRFRHILFLGIYGVIGIWTEEVQHNQRLRPTAFEVFRMQSGNCWAACSAAVGVGVVLSIQALRILCLSVGLLCDFDFLAMDNTIGRTEEDEDEEAQKKKRNYRESI
jgi:hypothetical protein